MQINVTIYGYVTLCAIIMFYKAQLQHTKEVDGFFPGSVTSSVGCLYLA